jgi:hypothetical protein
MIKNSILFLSILFCFSESPAQGLFESTGTAQNTVQLGGYARGSAYGGGDIYDYASVFGEFCLQSSYATRDVALFADVRFRSGYFFGEPESTFELKEAYASYRPGKFSFSLGQQIVTWGKTDGFNPTNNITPNNYFFFSAKPDDQKLSNFMLRNNWQLGHGISWETIAIPVYRPSVYRYDLFDMGANVTFVENELPTVSFENGSLATRLSFELRGIGFSLSWFNGYDPFYGFKVKGVEWESDTPKVTNTAAFYRKNSAGFDLEIPIKQIIFRTEAAFDFTNNYKAEMHIPNPGAKAVGALELPLGNFMFLLQYIGSYTFDFEQLNGPQMPQSNNPLELMTYAETLINFESEQFNRHIFHQQEAWNHEFSGTIRQSLAYNTLDITVSAYYNLTSDEWLLRPEVVWKAAGSLSVSIGAQWMHGPDGTIFSHASKLMNGVFLELKTSF